VSASAEFFGVFRVHVFSIGHPHAARSSWLDRRDFIGIFRAARRMVCLIDLQLRALRADRPAVNAPLGLSRHTRPRAPFRFFPHDALTRPALHIRLSKSPAAPGIYGRASQSFSGSRERRHRTLRSASRRACDAGSGVVRALRLYGDAQPPGVQDSYVACTRALAALG